MDIEGHGLIICKSFFPRVEPRGNCEDANRPPSHPLMRAKAFHERSLNLSFKNKLICRYDTLCIHGRKGWQATRNTADLMVAETIRPLWVGQLRFGIEGFKLGQVFEDRVFWRNPLELSNRTIE